MRTHSQRPFPGIVCTNNSKSPLICRARLTSTSMRNSTNLEYALAQQLDFSIDCLWNSIIARFWQNSIYPTLTVPILDKTIPVCTAGIKFALRKTMHNNGQKYFTMLLCSSPKPLTHPRMCSNVQLECSPKCELENDCFGDRYRCWVCRFSMAISFALVHQFRFHRTVCVNCLLSPLDGLVTITELLPIASDTHSLGHSRILGDASSPETFELLLSPSAHFLFFFRFRFGFVFFFSERIFPNIHRKN